MIYKIQGNRVDFTLEVGTLDLQNKHVGAYDFTGCTDFVVSLVDGSREYLFESDVVDGKIVFGTSGNERCGTYDVVLTFIDALGDAKRTKVRDQIAIVDAIDDLGLSSAEIASAQANLSILVVDGGRSGNSGVTLDQLAGALSSYYTKTEADSKFLTAHQSLKTINGQSIVGSGNLTIEGTSSGSSMATLTYSASDFASGYYDLSFGVGKYASNQPYPYDGLQCLIVRVVKGDVVGINVQGGNGGRAYGLTDKTLKLYAVANQGVRFNSTITIERDGYLIVNNKYSSVAEPSVTITTNVADLHRVVEWEYIDAPCRKNVPLPIGKESIKVLFVGNSFIENSTKYLSNLISASGIADKVACYRLIRGSGSLSHHLAEASNNKTLTKCGGNLSVETTSGTLAQLLSNDWDVVVFCQYSKEASDRGKLLNSIDKFINLVKDNCSNNNITFGYQFPWGHTIEDTEDVLNGAISLAKYIVSAQGIDVIIPCGVAIQNARNTSLLDDNYLTGDNWHLNDRGCYIAGCCVFQSIFAPIFNKTIVGNSYAYSNFPNPTLAQRCASYALNDMWNVTLGIDESYTPPIEPTKVELTGLSISIADTISEATTASVVYTPTNVDSSYKGVTWSITSGSEYATINSSGIVTPVADGTITIKAVSTHSTSISATKQVVVSVPQEETPKVELVSINISIADSISEATQAGIEYNPTDTDADYKGVTWSIEGGSEFASISTDGVVTPIASGSVTIKATSTHNTTISTTKTITISVASSGGDDSGSTDNPTDGYLAEDGYVLTSPFETKFVHGYWAQNSVAGVTKQGAFIANETFILDTKGRYRITIPSGVNVKPLIAKEDGEKWYVYRNTYAITDKEIVMPDYKTTIAPSTNASFDRWGMNISYANSQNATTPQEIADLVKLIKIEKIE